MGKRVGTYSRRLESELKGYLGVLQEASTTGAPRPWVDADWNEFVAMQIRNAQRMIQRGFGDGSSDLGFKAVQAAASANDFAVKAGTGDAGFERAGRMAVGGFLVPIDGGMDYTTAVLTDAKVIHHVSTALSATVLTDDSTRWNVDELKDRKLVPDIGTLANSYTITSNTKDTITVNGNMTAGGAVSGDVYRVELSTPVANRTDTVYLDVYLDEIDVTEDGDLDHGAAFGAGSQQVGANRLKLTAEVFVNEGGKGHFVPAVPAGEDADLHRMYKDSNGEEHWITPIAEFARLAGNANVLTAMITDKRQKNWGMKSVRDGLVGPDHTAESLLRRFEEVRTFVTVGDGVTTFGDYNGESGLRAAVAAAINGQTIFIKRGTYTLTAEIDVTKKIRFVGEGLSVSGTKVVAAAGLRAFDVAVGGSGTTFENFEIDGADNAVESLKFDNCSRSVVSQMQFSNIGTYGVHILDCVNMGVYNCEFSADIAAGGILVAGAGGNLDSVIADCEFDFDDQANDRDCGIVIDASAQMVGLVIRGCTFRDGQGGIFVDNGSIRGLSIEGCRFDSSLFSYGITIEQSNDAIVIANCEFEAGVGKHCLHIMDTAGGGGCDDVRIIGNHFGAPSGNFTWVYLDAVYQATIVGNTFDGSRASYMLLVNGKAAGDEQGSAVVGNIFRGGGVATIAIHLTSDSSGSVVANNKIYSVNGIGVYVNASGCLVNGNHIDTTVADGIALHATSHDCTIVGNTIIDAEDSCIQTNGSDRHVISGNRLARTAGVGDREISMNGSIDCVVSGNNCSQNNGAEGEIQADSVQNTFEGNIALVDMTVSRVITAMSFHRLDTQTGDQTQKGFFSGVVQGVVSNDCHWQHDSGANMHVACKLSPQDLPHGWMLQGFDAYVGATVAAHEMYIQVLAHAYADGTIIKVAEWAKVGAPGLAGVEVEVSSNAVNTQIDWETNGYSIMCNMNEAGGGSVLKLHRIKLRLKQSSYQL